MLGRLRGRRLGGRRLGLKGLDRDGVGVGVDVGTSGGVGVELHDCWINCIDMMLGKNTVSDYVRPGDDTSSEDSDNSSIMKRDSNGNHDDN